MYAARRNTTSILPSTKYCSGRTHVFFRRCNEGKEDDQRYTAEVS